MNCVGNSEARGLSMSISKPKEVELSWILLKGRNHFKLLIKKDKPRGLLTSYMDSHKILVTSPEAKFLFSLFGAFWGFGLWTGTWPRACQYFAIKNIKGELFVIIV